MTVERDRKWLVELLKSLHLDKSAETQERPYRYVIYARKSTDDTKKQVRSLPDQIIECKEFAGTNKLRVVEIIQESGSAKEAGTRLEFRRMLNGLASGKYDGIIAWHPDRLARNMKDAGEIIDLLDKGIIKALQFKSFTFDNTPSGKMTLGITFVLSKEYSDQLSENVGRGNRRSLEEGKSIGQAKHGYYKDALGHLRPDDNNYLLISNAFKMRLDGKTLDEIAIYLNESGYTQWRRTEEGAIHRIFKMGKKEVRTFLHNPVYVGVLRHGKVAIDLVDQYDFEPMITVEDFMRVNALERGEVFKLARRYRKAQERVANLMAGMVICETCGEPTTQGITPKGATKYFYYRCNTEGCERRGKSTRAKVIMDYAYALLDTKPFSTPASYEHYEREIKRVSEERMIQERNVLVSLKGQLRKEEQKMLGIKDTLYGDGSAGLKEMAEGDMAQAIKRKEELGEAIEQKRTFIAQGKVSILTYQQFVELMDNMSKTLRSYKKMADMDFLMRKIFLNFTVSSKNVVKSTLAAPFEEFYRVNVSQGGHGEI